MAQARRRGQTEAIVKQMSAKQSFAGEIPVKPGPMAARFRLPASVICGSICSVASRCG
jgi:hypothetical protein